MAAQALGVGAGALLCAGPQALVCGAVGAALITAGMVGAWWMSSSSVENADEQAGTQLDSGTAAATCATGNCGGNDPCSGLRKQLADHRKKLEDYKRNPLAHDNKGFLGHGRDAKIIAARIASLEHQIKNFADQLKKCEEENAK